MEAHPESTTDRDRLTVAVWHAQALFQADQASDALKAYDDCAEAGRSLLGAHPGLRTEIQLGRAECLSALGRCREALALFTQVWTHAAEESPPWWRAFVGQLECHRRLGSDVQQIVQAIRQRRYLSPDLGAPRWKRRLDALEAALAGSAEP